MIEPELQHLRLSLRSGDPLPANQKEQWLEAVDAELKDKPAPRLSSAMIAAVVFGGVAAGTTSPGGLLELAVAVGLASGGYALVLKACGDGPWQLAAPGGPASNLDRLESVTLPTADS